MAKICNECGYPLNGNEDICPECGNPICSNNSESQTDSWDYTQYRKGIFQQWYFKCKKKDENDSYDSLNDTLLLLNLVFRALWYIIWPIILLFIISSLFLLGLNMAGISYASFVIVILGIFLGVYFLFFI